METEILILGHEQVDLEEDQLNYQIHLQMATIVLQKVQKPVLWEMPVMLKVIQLLHLE